MSARAAAFGAYLAALWAAHDFADHVVQTDHQAAGKAAAEGWVAPMTGHVGGYTAVQVGALLALRPLGLRPRLGRLAAAVAWSAGTHALLDRRWPVKAALSRTGSARFAEMTTPLAGAYLADQAFHHAALAISAWLLARGATDSKGYRR